LVSLRLHSDVNHNCLSLGFEYVLHVFSTLPTLWSWEYHTHFIHEKTKANKGEKVLLSLWIPDSMFSAQCVLLYSSPITMSP
jgi:hypothetical protein